MEELVLTEPVVVPEQVTNKYHVVATTFDLEAQSRAQGVGLIVIRLRDNNGGGSSYTYHGQQAVDMIKVLNTANLTTKSMHKRILERLAADGFLPGTVTGTPDP